MLDEERDETGEGLSAPVKRVREFVEQQLQAGQPAHVVSFALAFVATEMGLHVTRGLNSLAVVRTVLQGVVAASSSFEAEGHSSASTEIGVTPTLGPYAVPKGTVVH